MRRLAILIVLLAIGYSAYAQTCCSGGVPVSANLGLPIAEAKTWQFAASYDHNQLTTLLDGASVLQDRRRERTTRAAIFELGYSISEKWSADLFFSLVQQLRIIEGINQQDRASTFGPGDIALLLKYKIVSKQGYYWSIGAGPKLPTGPSALRDEQGLTHVADLQPGSGALDWLFWSQAGIKAAFRPSMNFSFNTVFSQKGTNDDYLGSQAYRFGNEVQLSLSIADQVLVKNQIFDPAVSFRYRQAFTDQIDEEVLPNTGGQWLFIEPAITYWLQPDLNISTSITLPLYAQVVGTQLSPSWRWNIGFFKALKTKNKLTPDFDKIDKL